MKTIVHSLPETGSDKATERARRTYDRGAARYDLQEWLPEKLAFRKWRKELWDLIPDGRVLEVGVGTGRNLKFYHDGLALTAIDFSPKMLSKAQKKAIRLGLQVDLRLMDVQQLEFEDHAFDSAVSTFVFCSVPEPLRGLSEVLRVLQPGGRAYFLEHVRSRKAVLGWMMDVMTPLTRRLSGANMNRDTVANVAAAGFRILEVRDLWLDIVKLIVAEKPGRRPKIAVTS